MTLDNFKTEIGSLDSNVFHHFSPPGAGIPRIVWAEYYREDLRADNIHVETSWEISVNVYTKSETEALIGSLEAMLNQNELNWRLDSVTYEDDTALLHYEYIVRT